MKILIVKLSAIGDVIHTLPVLNALRDRYPDAKITWLVEVAAAPIIFDHPALDRVLVSYRKKWANAITGSGNQSRQEAVKEAFTFIRDLRRTRYDLIIDFQNLLKSGVMIGLAKGSRKVGFGKGMQRNEGAHLFYNRRVAPVSMEIHAIERYQMLLKAVGVETDTIDYRIPISDADNDRVAQLLRDAKIEKDQRMVAINPMARWETKLWKQERFAQVSDQLMATGQVKVVFTGGPADKNVIDQILGMMKCPAINLAGQTTLKQLAALYARADLLISTDTGPMHLAAAIETPVVALFGPTAPWRTGPYGDQHQVLFPNDPCAPCFKRTCETNLCMSHITVDEVVKAVATILKIG